MYQSLSLRHFRECPDLVKSLNVSKFVGEAEHLDGSRCTREERLAGAIVKCQTSVEFIDLLLARGQHTLLRYRQAPVVMHPTECGTNRRRMVTEASVLKSYLVIRQVSGFQDIIFKRVISTLRISIWRSSWISGEGIGYEPRWKIKVHSAPG